MHVVMISDVESRGGAAVSASRLAEGLVGAGARVTRIVFEPDGLRHAWSTQALRGRIRSRVIWNTAQRYAKRVSLTAAIGLQALWLHRSLQTTLERLGPDVINVHNIHGAGWWPNLVSVCLGQAPTVWTLHDMWSFTGRCGYSYECSKFMTGCNASCPTPTEYPSLDPGLISGAWRLRRRLFAKNMGLGAVCPSKWLASEAQRGLWADHRVDVIPYGIPLDVYLPIDRGLARRALGVPSGGPVLMVVADRLAARRKGGILLADAFRRVKTRPLVLVTMGEGPLPIADKSISSHHLGYVDHERTKVLAYSAADFLVHPALVDNLPNVAMEAIACGTPCVSFAIGGLPDMVRPGLTGWLARDMSPQALADAIDDAWIDIQRGADLRLSCRKIAESEYAEEMQARRYLELFDNLKRIGAASKSVP